MENPKIMVPHGQIGLYILGNPRNNDFEIFTFKILKLLHFLLEFKSSCLDEI